MNTNNVIVIFGPTGVGKTSLSLELAAENGEIISVDSMQVYKYLDIGTAKPDPEELASVPHHLIDVVTPDIQFSAGDFKRNSEKLIPEIFSKGKVPYLVGGTGLYFTSLIKGMANIPAIEPDVKQYLVDKCDKIGLPRMYKILQRLDPIYAGKIHFNDTQRTLRALEVIKGTGKTFTSFLVETNKKPDFNYIILGINSDRQELYRKIDQRVDIMVESGLVDEVSRVLNMGYKKDDPGLKGIGYKEIIAFLENEISLERAIELIKRNSRRYAKRQLIWFRHQLDGITWFENTEEKAIKSFIHDKCMT